MRELVWCMVIGLATACGGGKSAPPVVPENAAAADCPATADAVVRSLADDGAKDQMAAVTADITKRCTEDKWTVEAVKCLGAAHDKGGVHDCGYQNLTQAQQDKLDQATAPLSAASIPRLMKQMEGFRDQLCVCKDQPCVEKVSDAMQKWSQEIAKEYKDPPKMTEEQEKQAAAIGEQMGKCMQTAIGASQPPPAPLSVTALDPANGDAAGGTTVKITGTSFIGEAGRQAKVYFGGKQGTVVRFASDTEMIVEAPAGKAKETVDVLVIFEPGGEMKLPKAFTYQKKKK